MTKKTSDSDTSVTSPDNTFDEQEDMLRNDSATAEDKVYVNVAHR
jgi:hypothetical protein